MLAARMRAGSKATELMKPALAPPPAGAGLISPLASVWIRFLLGIDSVRRSGADLGIQRQGDLVGTRTIQVTILRINGCYALGVFARLGEGDQLDEFVGRVLAVL